MDMKQNLGWWVVMLEKDVGYMLFAAIRFD